MQTIAYIEMNAFGIIILLFFLHNQKSSGSLSLDEKIFNGILIFMIIEQLMDAGQWALDGMNFPGVYPLQMFCYTLGYTVGPVITCLWLMYCDLRVNMDERGLKKRTKLYILPLIANVILLIVNFYYPLVFEIDAAHVYHRLNFFWVFMTLTYLYGAAAMIWVSRMAFQPVASAERMEFRYMALFIIPPIIGGILQWIFYGISLMWLTMMLSIIMVYTKVLSRQILIDPMTGLNNRRKLNQYLGMKIKSVETNHTLFLMITDVDDFKSINDHFGHTCGDRALLAIAEILKSVCSHLDYFLSRFGGDEFLIIGQDTNENAPGELAQKINTLIDEYNQTAQQPFRLSLSIGWAYYNPNEMASVDALLNAADQSMYQVKQAHKMNSLTM